MSDEPLRLTVAQIRQEAVDVISVRLTSTTARELPPWTPGAHIDVSLPVGFVRQYSLCGNPDDRRSYRIAVLRERDGRGGSEWMHNELAEGDLLTMAGLRNNFELVPARRYLFIAGGIGITPLLPMVRQLDDTERPWRLVYGGRRLDSMAFIEELDELDGGRGRVSVFPEDTCGLLDLAAVCRGITSDDRVYCCGPPGLLDAVVEMGKQWPSGTVRIERFVAPGRPLPRPASRSFVVYAARSDVTVVVPPSKSILEALRDAGIEAASSCEEGLCGTCETVVLDGTPDHRDSVLTESEHQGGKTMTICCSRSNSDRLVLDI